MSLARDSGWWFGLMGVPHLVRLLWQQEAPCWGFCLGFLLPPVCEADPLPVASFGAFFLLLLRLVSLYVWYEYVRIVLFPSPCTFSFFTGTCL